MRWARTSVKPPGLLTRLDGPSKTPDGLMLIVTTCPATVTLNPLESKCSSRGGGGRGAPAATVSDAVGAIHRSCASGPCAKTSTAELTMFRGSLHLSRVWMHADQPKYQEVARSHSCHLPPRFRGRTTLLQFQNSGVHSMELMEFKVPQLLQSQPKSMPNRPFAAAGEY